MEFVVIARCSGAQQDSEHVATWLNGQVLPHRAERTRFDLVPLGPT
jgi:hypothetical protein